MWVLHGMFPMPQDWMPKTCNNWLEVKHTKGGFHPLNFAFASNWRRSHFTWAFTHAFTHLLINLLLDCMHIIRCMHLFGYGLGDVATFMNWKMIGFCFLYLKGMHLLKVWVSNLLCNIWNGTCANFSHPFWPHLNLIQIPLGYFKCFRGSICSFNCPLWKQQLKLKPNYFKNLLKIINNVGIAQTLNIIFDMPQPFLGISQKKPQLPSLTTLWENRRFATRLATCL